MMDEHEFLKSLFDELHKTRGFLYNGQIIPADRGVQGMQNKIHSRMEKIRHLEQEKDKDAN